VTSAESAFMVFVLLADFSRNDSSQADSEGLLTPRQMPFLLPKRAKALEGYKC